MKGKRNGKGIEYHDNDKVEFKGEYLNWREWKGKRYDGNGKISYKLNNEKNKIKEYNYIGNLEFVGEYLNGERHGKGKEYNEDSKLIFEGEYRSDIIWKGIGYDENGNIIIELKKGKGYLKQYQNGKLFENEYWIGKKMEKKKCIITRVN